MQLSDAITLLQEQAEIYGPDTELITRDLLGATRAEVQTRPVTMKNGISRMAILLEAKCPPDPAYCDGCGWTKGHSSWCRFNVENESNAAKNYGQTAATAAQADAAREI